MIDFFTAGTPNGYKISIMLEECELPYTVRFMNLTELEQKQPAFTSINPNGRIPAIVDRDEGDFPVFESGAILIYLAEKAGKLIPSDRLGRSRITQWVAWQMAGLGPMMGQLNVFRHYFPERLPSVIDRYSRESYRLFGVLEGQLKSHAYVAGDEYSIADIACWPWIFAHGWSQLSLTEYPALKRWFDVIGARPAVKRGLLVPPPTVPKDEKHYAEVVKETRKTLS
jgi:GSH-dependent disulfide-bond oxidoreductase